jgi:hypothetical protein
MMEKKKKKLLPIYWYTISSIETRLELVDVLSLILKLESCPLRKYIFPALEDKNQFNSYMNPIPALTWNGLPNLCVQTWSSPN